MNSSARIDEACPTGFTGSNAPEITCRVGAVTRDGEVASETVHPTIVAASISYADLLETLTSLDPSLAALAATRADTAMIGRLIRNVCATTLAFTDDRSIVVLASEFLDLVARMSDNRALMLARAGISPYVAPFIELIVSRLPAARSRLLSAHREVLDCIRKSDASGARNTMRQYLCELRDEATRAGLDLRWSVAVGSPGPAATQGKINARHA